MCESCHKDCSQKFPSQKKSIILLPEFLNTVGAKVYLQLPFCVHDCNSNCNLNFGDFHFVAVCLKNHCRTTYLNLNDPECNGGELSDNSKRLFMLTQLPGTRVTLSRVGICIERTASDLWKELQILFNNFETPLELCIEYWVECGACCTSEETALPSIG